LNKYLNKKYDVIIFIKDKKLTLREFKLSPMVQTFQIFYVLLKPNFVKIFS